MHRFCIPIDRVVAGASMTSNDRNLDAIRRPARAAERRLRHGRALRFGSLALCGALAVALVVLLARKLGFASWAQERGIVGAVVSLAALATAVAWAWRVPPGTGARVLDRFYGLHDRLSSALAFSGEPAGAQTAFMAAAIDDGVAAASRVRARQAVRLPLPRALGVAAGLGFGLVVVGSIQVRARAPSSPQAETLDAVELAPDDLDEVKEFLKELDRRELTDETRVAVGEFNKLVDDLASQRIDRTEAFRRMQALEDKFLPGAPSDSKAVEQSLEAMGEALKKAALSRPAGAALSENDAARARDALHNLARKFRTAGEGVDQAKLDEVREALKKAGELAARKEAERLRSREQLESDILKRKSASLDGGAADEERSLLEKKQRELERLDRELGEERAARQELDRLDRELEQAAEDLLKDLGQGADDLDRGAEDLNRLDQRRMTQQEKEDLRQKLKEMRELVRQQGGAGKGQGARLKQFARIARGQRGRGQGTGSEGAGQDGQNDSQGSRGQRAGERGREGQQGGPGGLGPKDGHARGEDGQGGETWVVGPNGEKMLLLSREPGGQGAGGEGTSSSPKGSGEGHDPNLQGKATAPSMATEDTEVQGGDTGQGGSRSQVILGAAERGFASGRYRKVYTEYHQVAEEALSKDEIPGGYRFYVKRYFQLIRPRDAK